MESLQGLSIIRHEAGNIPRLAYRTSAWNRDSIDRLHNLLIFEVFSGEAHVHTIHL